MRWGLIGGSEESNLKLLHNYKLSTTRNVYSEEKRFTHIMANHQQEMSNLKLLHNYRLSTILTRSLKYNGISNYNSNGISNYNSNVYWCVFFNIQLTLTTNVL